MHEVKISKIHNERLVATSKGKKVSQDRGGLAADPSRQHKQRHALGQLAPVFEILSLKK
jgi:hypothetical protein